MVAETRQLKAGALTQPTVAVATATWSWTPTAIRAGGGTKVTRRADAIRRPCGCKEAWRQVKQDKSRFTALPVASKH